MIAKANPGARFARQYEQFMAAVERELDVDAGLAAVLDVASQAAFAGDVKAWLNVSAGLAAVLGAEAGSDLAMPHRAADEGGVVAVNDASSAVCHLPVPRQPTSSQSLAGALATLSEVLRALETCSQDEQRLADTRGWRPRAVTAAALLDSRALVAEVMHKLANKRVARRTVTEALQRVRAKLAAFTEELATSPVADTLYPARRSALIASHKLHQAMVVVEWLFDHSDEFSMSEV